MTKKEAIKLFEEKKVRTVWDDEQEKCCNRDHGLVTQPNFVFMEQSYYVCIVSKY